MDWTAIRLLYLSELRAALRERSVLINGILIPLLMYPLMMWVMFSAILFVTARTESFASRVEIAGLPAEHRGLLERLEEEGRIEVTEVDVPSARTAAAYRTGIEERLLADELDAALIFEATPDGPQGNAAVALMSNGSSDQSQTARGRLERALSAERSDWLDRIAGQHGLEGAEWRVFEVESNNLATGVEMGQFLMGMMIPLFFVIMIANGCLYPAIDSTAGERERNTWETTSTLATRRIHIVAAKYLYVATMGTVAGALNAAAMVVSFRSFLGPLLARLGNGDGSGFAFELPLRSLPVLLLTAVLLGALIGAAMMILAAFARTFKEGQSMVTPLYLLVIFPVVVLNDPSLEFTPPLAAIPVVNVVLLLRQAIAGNLLWLQLGITLLSNAAAIVGCLWLASRVLRVEEVATGSFEGNLFQFLRQRLKPVGGKA
ncbi:MAG: ABC transporter permease [Holophagales bacterium]|nr:ABC transporter permease [Holophagales bacterium]MYD21115.1 ABC transporter permease [Holophagales bacterium]MYI34426.1 ABC transporter permease [Holophagales bacterium]